MGAGSQVSNRIFLRASVNYLKSIKIRQGSLAFCSKISDMSFAGRGTSFYLRARGPKITTDLLAL